MDRPGANQRVWTKADREPPASLGARTLAARSYTSETGTSPHPASRIDQLTTFYRARAGEEGTPPTARTRQPPVVGTISVAGLRQDLLRQSMPTPRRSSLSAGRDRPARSRPGPAGATCTFNRSKPTALQIDRSSTSSQGAHGNRSRMLLASGLSNSESCNRGQHVASCDVGSYNMCLTSASKAKEYGSSRARKR